MSDPYDNPSSLPNTVNYVFKGAKIYGGGAVNPVNAVEEMQLVKQLWLQTEGRQVHHFILCLTPKESKALCARNNFCSSYKIRAFNKIAELNSGF